MSGLFTFSGVIFKYQYQWILTYQSININITDMYNLELLSSTIRTYYPRDS